MTAFTLIGVSYMLWPGVGDGAWSQCSVAVAASCFSPNPPPSVRFSCSTKQTGRFFPAAWPAAFGPTADR